MNYEYVTLNTFYFLLPIEKVLFFVQIFELEYLMDLHVLRSPESGKHSFSVWSVCVCACAYLCVCYQHNSEPNHSKNIRFGMLHLYYVQVLLEIFYKGLYIEPGEGNQGVADLSKE